MPEFTACHVFAAYNQQLSERKSRHRIIAARIVLDRFRGSPRNKTRVRLPLTWSILAKGYRSQSQKLKECGRVTWLGLALTYCLLCRASEVL